MSVVRHHAQIMTATRKWEISEPRRFMSSLEDICTLNQIRTKEGLRVIDEDILGLCYKDLLAESESEDQGELSS